MISLRTLVLLGAVGLGLGLGAPARAFTIANVTSAGGINAWLVEDHTLPVVTIDIAFRGGGALDPVEKEGLATLTTDLLDEGAGDLDSTAYQGREEDLATSISFSAGADAVSASLRTITTNLGPACDLLRLALVAPRFDDAAVARVRNQLLAEVARAERQPRYIASRDWWANAYPDHPYGRPLQGTPETLARITVDDMRQFVHAHFAKDALIIGVVGDISPEALKILLDQTFGALPAQMDEGSVDAATVTNPGSLILAGLPIPQSVVTFGEAGIKRDDPDWYAALLVDYILGGGGFDSRLTLEVREKRGLAYSVYTMLDPRQHGGVILGGVATENAHVADSIAIIRSEWRRMHDEGPTAKELADAKTYITGSFPLTLDSTERIASTLVIVQRDGLGIDYLDRRSGIMNAVTLADAKRVAKRLFDPAALSFVVVGAPEHLEGARRVSVSLSETPPGILTPAPGTVPPPLPTVSVGQGQGLR